MSKAAVHDGGSLGPIRLYSAATSSAPGEVSYELEAPCRHFSLQVQASTAAVLTLLGHLAPSDDSTGGITLIAWSSDAVGTLLSTESTGGISRVSATITGGASSGLSAWFSATP